MRCTRHMSGELRPMVMALTALGPLPTEAATDPTTLGRWEELAGQISQPLSDDEVTVLAGLLPADESDAFGMAWTLIHVLESAPGWPGPGALESAPAYWGGVLRTRLDNPRSRPLGN